MLDGDAEDWEAEVWVDGGAVAGCIGGEELIRFGHSAVRKLEQALMDLGIKLYTLRGHLLLRW